MTCRFISSYGGTRESGARRRIACGRNVVALIGLAALLGNGAVFCWWSYAEPWFLEVGGVGQSAPPVVLVVMGAAMALGL